jgi:hypothetical protein
MAARLEVLLGIVISAGQHVLRNVEEVPVGDEGQPAPPQLSKMPQ